MHGQRAFCSAHIRACFMCSFEHRVSRAISVKRLNTRRERNFTRSQRTSPSRKFIYRTAAKPRISRARAEFERMRCDRSVEFIAKELRIDRAQ